MVRFVRRNIVRNATVEFLPADISDPLRNLAIDHAPKSDTSQKHYLNRHVSFDLWAVQRGTAPQKDIVLQGASHGHSRSARRPFGLTKEQSDDLRNHAPVQKMTVQLEAMPLLQWKVAHRQIKIVKSRLFREKKTAVRDKWTINQAIIDIERNLRGDSASFTDIAKSRDARPMSAAQK